MLGNKVSYERYTGLLQKHCGYGSLITKDFGSLSKPSQRKVLDEKIRALLDEAEEKCVKAAEVQKKRTKQEVRARRSKRGRKIVEEQIKGMLNEEKTIPVPQESLLKAPMGQRMVEFNVGGKIVPTTTETLSKEPASLLYGLGSGIITKCPRDANGVMFLDRNPKCFEAMIEYLRSGWYDKDAGSYFTKQLYNEALYFGVSSLTKELGGIPLDSVFNLQFYETKALTEWCEAESFTLLHRASRDGFDSKSFHDHCDDIKGTLTITKTVTGYIFGGYTEVGWNSDELPTIRRGSGYEFLFSLRNPQNTDPIKFPVRYFNKYKSVLHCKKYGPSFGANSKGHCEIHVAESPNTTINSHVLGFPAMYDGKGYDNKIFCGSERFQVEDYEVFLVTNKRIREPFELIGDDQDDDE